MQKQREIVTVLGQQGTGKTTLIRESLLPLCDRPVWIVDTMGDYLDVGLVFDSWPSLRRYLVARGPNASGVYVLRTTAETDGRALIELVRRMEARGTLVLDEAGKWMSPNEIPEALRDLIHYGRHWDVSLIFAARRASEIHRDATSQADVLFSFRQTEPRDVQLMASIWHGFRKLPRLRRFEYLVFSTLDNSRFSAYISQCAEP